jgi:UDP-N-acetylmuramate dehydrogenase
MADLHAVSAVSRDLGLPVIVIGRGSNVLIADSGFAGLIVQLGNFFTHLDLPLRPSNIEVPSVEVRAGGGVLLPVAARQSASVGLRGFEWAVGVPGTIGGAIRMNAGGHGSDVAQSLRSVEIFHLPSGQIRTLNVSDVGLRFRGSSLTDDDIVVSAILELEWGSSVEATAMIDEIVKWRRANQPGGQNAGSVFINPVPHQVSAGELIDQSGCRGVRIGSAEVSTKHANFIQSDSSGSAVDVLAVMRAVRTAVERHTGYRLRSEVRLVGFPADVVNEFSFDDGLANGRESSS